MLYKKLGLASHLVIDGITANIPKSLVHCRSGTLNERPQKLFIDLSDIKKAKEVFSRFKFFHELRKKIYSILIFHELQKQFLVDLNFSWEGPK